MRDASEDHFEAMIANIPQLVAMFHEFESPKLNPAWYMFAAAHALSALFFFKTNVRTHIVCDSGV